MGVMFLSCRKETISTDPNLSLSFSKTKINFDTVFTSVGSATMNFKIWNKGKNALKISSIKIMGGENSFFRLNVDGRSVYPSLNDYVINGNDSMYAFIEVTIDPKNQNLPFVIEDSIEFVTNGNRQYVKLEAWGQYALFYRNLGLAGTIVKDTPIVFVDYVLIPQNTTLTIQAGATIYCHRGTLIDVQGELILQGTKESPITIRGDRLERVYGKFPGQWEGIMVRPTGKMRTEHSIIENANFGIFDSFGYNPSVTKLSINKTIIRNMSSFGIVGLNTKQSITNSLVYNCGRLMYITDNGGDYSIKHTIFDNTKSVFIRQPPSFSFQNYSYINSLGETVNNAFKAEVLNCIIYGGENDEIKLSNEAGTNKVVGADIFKNCILKSKEYSFLNNFFNQLPLYENINSENYKPLQTSPIVNKGVNTGITDDITNKLRDGQPDIGCYEY